MAKTRTHISKEQEEDSSNVNIKSILQTYLKEYFADRKDIDKFEQYINDQMAAYEESEQRRREDKQKRAGEADEDGFMTVVSKKPKVFEGEDGGLESVPQALPIKILPNFYQHTKRTKEERATHLEELRRKFEEDKKILERLKQSKIFTPL